MGNTNYEIMFTSHHVSEDNYSIFTLGMNNGKNINLNSTKKVKANNLMDAELKSLNNAIAKVLRKISANEINKNDKVLFLSGNKNFVECFNSKNFGTCEMTKSLLVSTRRIIKEYSNFSVVKNETLIAYDDKGLSSTYLIKKEHFNKEDIKLIRILETANNKVSSEISPDYIFSIKSYKSSLKYIFQLKRETINKLLTLNEIQQDILHFIESESDEICEEKATYYINLIKKVRNTRRKLKNEIDNLEAASSYAEETLSKINSLKVEEKSEWSHDDEKESLLFKTKSGIEELKKAL